MQKCNKCHKTAPCGCGDTPFTTNSNYGNCTVVQPCSEFMYSSCIIYNGPKLAGLNIIPGMNLNQVIQAIYLYDINEDCIITDCHSPFVQVNQTGLTNITVGWATVDEAGSYTVSYRDPLASPATWTNVDVLPSVTSYNIINLTCGTTYEIYVTANFSSSNCDSLTINVTTLNC